MNSAAYAHQLINLNESTVATAHSVFSRQNPCVKNQISAVWAKISNRNTISRSDSYLPPSLMKGFPVSQLSHIKVMHCILHIPLTQMQALSVKPQR